MSYNTMQIDQIIDVNKRMFIRFLKIEGALAKYIHYSEEEGETHRILPLHYAFSWSETEEGFEYWHNLERRWLKFNRFATSLLRKKDNN